MSINNNIVTLIGNLGKEAEIKETTAGTVAKFSLAVYRNGKGEQAITDWFIVSAWHNLARGMDDIPKGSRLIVVGSVIQRTYEVEGVKKHVTEIQAREIGIDISVKKEVEDEEEIPF